MAENPDQPQAGMIPLYTVGPIEDSSMIGSSGGYIRSKRVYYRLADGSSSYIEVPYADFNRANVERLLDAAVGTHLDVALIQGDAVPKFG